MISVKTLISKANRVNCVCLCVVSSGSYLNNKPEGFKHDQHVRYEGSWTHRRIN